MPYRVIQWSTGNVGTYAPGASGNVPLEDLVHLLDAMGVETGVDLDALLEAARLACSLVGRDVDSHIGRAGARFAHLEPAP